MDPESCLQMIIDLLEDASNPDFWNDEALSVEDEVGYLARCLRDWLTRGGFAPEVAPDRLAWLAARRGILVIHASSRYNQPFDVLSNTALAAGRPAIGVTTLISGPGANADWDANSNECVIVPTREFLTAFTSVFPESEDNGRVTRKLLAPDSTVPDPKSVWTDDRNATVEMMNLGSFLSWRNRF